MLVFFSTIAMAQLIAIASYSQFNILNKRQSAVLRGKYKIRGCQLNKFTVSLKTVAKRKVFATVFCTL